MDQFLIKIVANREEGQDKQEKVITEKGEKLQSLRHKHNRSHLCGSKYY